MKNELLTYQQARERLAKRGHNYCLRHVRSLIWKHHKICPVVDEGYHLKRVKARDVDKLAEAL